METEIKEKETTCHGDTVPDTSGRETCPPDPETARAEPMSQTAGAALTETATELTEDEKQLVREYAINDAEVRRVIISDYLARLKTADPAPVIMQGDAGAGPVYTPRPARDLREAAILAEALLKRK